MMRFKSDTEGNNSLLKQPKTVDSNVRHSIGMVNNEYSEISESLKRDMLRIVKVKKYLKST